MISKAKRTKAARLVEQIEASCSILRNKLASPLPMAKLEDVKEHLAMTKADLEEVESIIRSAIWRTTVTP